MSCVINVAAKYIGFFVLFSGQVLAQQTAGVRFNPVSGNYVVTYPAMDTDNNEFLDEVVFVPATKIDPKVAIKLKVSTGTETQYRYSVHNGAKSVQSIGAFDFSGGNISDGSVQSPPEWFGTWSSALDQQQADFAGGWIYLAKPGKVNGLMRGEKENNFSFTSQDLPGVGVMRFRGATPTIVWAGEIDPDSDVAKQLADIERNNFVPRLTAVPRIPLSNPWDTGTVLANIRTHLNTDMVPMQLIDPVFANELNRLFTAAIEAAKHNNDKGVKENLKDIRKALKKAHRDMDDEDNHTRKHRHRDKDDSDDWEHTDPKQKPKPVFIDKLAARVLDFDVKYVLGRLAKDEKD